MKRKQSLLTLLLILLLAGAVRLLLTADRAAEAVREDLSSHILRFHVLANSDSEEDQALKLSVKRIWRPQRPSSPPTRTSSAPYPSP